MDKFEQWIKKHRKNIALTDKSYKKVYQKQYKKELTDDKVNTELATYGDAVLKLALCEILWENKTKVLTEEKKKYESDEILVKIIAKHYDILSLLRFDKKDKNIPQNYDYNNDNHKYIATAIEACLGAMYLDKSVSWRDIVSVVKNWKNMIDTQSGSR